MLALILVFIFHVFIAIEITKSAQQNVISPAKCRGSACPNVVFVYYLADKKYEEVSCVSLGVLHIKTGYSGIKAFREFFPAFHSDINDRTFLLGQRFRHIILNELQITAKFRSNQGGRRSADVYKPISKLSVTAYWKREASGAQSDSWTMGRDKFGPSKINRFLGESRHTAGREPERQCEGSDKQSRQRGNGPFVAVQKLTKTADHYRDIGYTFLRGLVGIIIFVLIYAGLKRIGTADKPRDKPNGEK